MANLAYTLERLRRRQRFRLWAIALPLLVIAVALPLLRPLRHPDPSRVSDDEFVRIETIRQLVTHGTFSLDPNRVAERIPVVQLPNGDWVAAQEPMLSVIGAGVYQILRLAKLSFDSDTILGPYLLTLILSTIPTAITATLLYRCGRLMELSRGKRMAVAFGAVACSGLLAYATVISPYPMAAMLITASLACLTHAAMTGPPPSTSAWITFAGFLAGLGAAVHPSVAALGLMLMFANLAMPWKRAFRLLATGLFILGTLIPLASHRVLMQRLTQSWLLPVPAPVLDVSPVTRPITIEDVEIITNAPSWLEQIFWRTVSMAATLFGPSGLLLHAPAMVVGLWGAILLSTRYWPKTTRAFAVACAAGLLMPLILWGWSPVRGGERMFGAVPVMAVCPPLFLWAGFFLRRRPGHIPNLSILITAWTIILLSAAITALGMLGPYPKGGFETYPPLQITQQHLLKPTTSPPSPSPSSRPSPPTTQNKEPREPSPAGS